MSFVKRNSGLGNIGVTALLCGISWYIEPHYSGTWPFIPITCSEFNEICTRFVVLPFFYSVCLGFLWRDITIFVRDASLELGTSYVNNLAGYWWYFHYYLQQNTAGYEPYSNDELWHLKERPLHISWSMLNGISIFDEHLNDQTKLWLLHERRLVHRGYSPWSNGCT